MTTPDEPVAGSDIGKGQFVTRNAHGKLVIIDDDRRFRVAIPQPVTATCPICGHQETFYSTDTEEQVSRCCGKCVVEAPLKLKELERRIGALEGK